MVEPFESKADLHESLNNMKKSIYGTFISTASAALAAYTFLHYEGAEKYYYSVMGAVTSIGAGSIARQYYKSGKELISNRIENLVKKLEKAENLEEKN